MTEDDFEEKAITSEILPSQQLQAFVKESGLEETKAKFLVDSFEDHFKMAAIWSHKANKIIVTNENQTIEMEQARTARLFLRKKRLEIESARVELKENSLKEGKAIDRVANFLKNVIIPTEEHLQRQEDFIKLKKEAEDKRILEEAYAKQEVDRLAQEKEDAKEKERLRIENEDLKKQQKNQEEKIKKQEDENNEKLLKEKQKTLKLEEELRIKRQADLKSLADKLRAEEALLKASDIDKLLSFRSAVMLIKIPEVKSQENKRILEDAKSHLFLAISKIKLQEEE